MRENKRRLLLLIIIILILIIAILLKIFVFYDKYKMPRGAIIEIKDEKLEVFDEIYLEDIIENTNVEIISDNYQITNRDTGLQGCYFVYKYKGFRKYEYNINYEVIDTVNPIFIYEPPATKSFFVNEATEEDLDALIKKIQYADNYDKNPELKIDGEVNFNEVGEYQLVFNVVDSSNNTISKETNIIIKERPIIEESENVEEEINEDIVEEDEEEKDTRTPFEEQIEMYKDDNRLIGIDVSKWQGEIDFEKVRDAGCEFVIMRLAVMKDKDSELKKDPTFDKNFGNAKRAGLKVGIYVYSEANNVDIAKSNAEFVINELDGEKLDFPVAFDWESWAYFNDMDMNLHMLNEMYEAFDNKLKEAGYETMLYGSQNYLNNVWLDIKDYTIWVAKYSEKFPNVNNEGNNFILWQNSNTGKIDGIDGDVDMDIFFK